jgi:hypothetical protein
LTERVLFARAAPFCGRDKWPEAAPPFGKELFMEDFPIWLKALIWLVVGGTIVYTVGMIIYSGLGS